MYLLGTRETKGIEPTAQSPIFDHFARTINRVGTTRTFDETEDYFARIHDKSGKYFAV